MSAPPPYRPAAPISHPRRPRPPAASVAVPASATATASTRSRSSQRPATTESSSSSSRPPAFPPSRMPAPLLSAQEYVALPPSVQRKYFSSFERQRLAERSLPQAPSPDVTSAMPPRPQTSHSSQRSTSQSRSHSRTRKRLRKARNAPDCDITQAEAQWFLSLPDKIIKTCLSRDEAILLAHRCEALFIDSSDSDHGPLDDAERRGRWPREDTSLHLQDSDAAESPRPSNHLASRPLPGRPSVSPRQISLRKNMPSTHNFARHSSAPPLPSPGAFPVYHQPVRPRATSNIVTPRYSGDANDSHAKHYQDPETRLKLREYLASAQKFDEVVEYGFPSNTQPVDRSAEAPRSDPYARLASRDMQTFLRDDAVSFLSSTIEDDSDEGGEEESSVADMDAPMTPLDHDEGFRGVPQLSESNKSSMESRSGAYHPWRANGSQDSHLAPFPQTLGNREMTLRMTLTRPELRADEAELYGWQQSEDRKHDPLALQDLPPENDDKTGMHGPFASHASKHAKLVRKFLGKVKKGK
ncbi:hypothetical protein HDK77DRAFT_478366 [Phyllosticta capitalensis]|uniref:uncharacterized protein n=1 Tax=Phyllosticta capitalensis TaxID=121624 RepID=UPI00312F87F6